MTSSTSLPSSGAGSGAGHPPAAPARAGGDATPSADSLMAARSRITTAIHTLQAVPAVPPASVAVGGLVGEALRLVNAGQGSSSTLAAQYDELLARIDRTVAQSGFGHHATSQAPPAPGASQGAQLTPGLPPEGASADAELDEASAQSLATQAGEQIAQQPLPITGSQEPALRALLR